jgi:LacI family transcriptional regulator
LLEQHTPPDAFFVANSTMALGVLDELRQRGLRPGHDVGLITFDDAPWAPLVHPPMSVVVQPAREIGLQAAKMLLERLDGHDMGVPTRTKVLPTSLRIRASSRRPRSCAVDDSG